MTYRTTVSDPLLRLLSFVIIAFIGMVLVFSLTGLYSVWVVLAVYLAVVVGLSYYLMRLFSLAMVETELLNDRIRLRWIQQNIFDKREDTEIRFSDVAEDGFMTSRIAKEYTLFLNSGREFSYKQFNWYTPRHEDLEQMGRDIREAIELYQERNPAPWVPEGYEKKTAQPLSDEEKKQVSLRLYTSVFAIIAIYVFVGFPVLKMMFPAATFGWEIKVLGVVTSIVFLVSKLFGSFHERKQRREQQAGAEETE